MNSAMSTFRHHGRLLPILLLTVALGSSSAQTHIVAPTPNKYSLADDVLALGRFEPCLHSLVEGVEGREGAHEDGQLADAAVGV